jgi:hypothetical protein
MNKYIKSHSHRSPYFQINDHASISDPSIQVQMLYVVIVVSSNNLTIGETKDDPLSSLELSCIPKGTPSFIHLYP